MSRVEMAVQAAYIAVQIVIENAARRHLLAMRRGEVCK